MDGLSVLNISKSFQETTALTDVSFEVAISEIVAILGPSGCGKSTLLSIIAGIEKPDQGDISWNGASILNKPAHQRGFGLMFQDLALFPHKNVYENVAFGLKLRKQPASEIKNRVQEVLEMVGLEGYEERDINTLSGGQAQRVALARSLAPEPHLLMLDEPLGSLDRNLRERLIFELKDILQNSQQTVLYVTHDQDEAFTIADKVVLMNDSRIEQIDTPREIYNHPGTVFVANFLGFSNLIPGKLVSKSNQVLVDTTIGLFNLNRSELSRCKSISGEDLLEKIEDGQPVTLFIRPDGATLDEEAEVYLQGIVREQTFRGRMYLTRIEINGTTLVFEFPSNKIPPKPSEEIILGLNPSDSLQVLPDC